MNLQYLILRIFDSVEPLCFCRLLCAILRAHVVTIHTYLLFDSGLGPSTLLEGLSCHAEGLSRKGKLL